MYLSGKKSVQTPENGESASNGAETPRTTAETEETGQGTALCSHSTG
jgi:hypothetical protein